MDDGGETRVWTRLEPISLCGRARGGAAASACIARRADGSLRLELYFNAKGGLRRGDRVDVEASGDLVRVTRLASGAFRLAASGTAMMRVVAPAIAGLAAQPTGRKACVIVDQPSDGVTVRLPAALMSGAVAIRPSTAHTPAPIRVGPVDAVRVLNRAGVRSLKMGADRWNVAGETLDRDAVAARINRIRGSDGKPPIAAADLV